MGKMNIFGFLLMSLALTACANYEPASPALVAAANRPLMCSTKEQCERYWQRAEFWISGHSNYKIQSVTDTVIQTFTPTRGDTDLGYVVRRERSQDGTSRIWLSPICANMFGCHMPLEQVAADFKDYVSETHTPRK